ncbi:CBS domain-containing protein [Heliobacterium chlorum]|uniref:CBS domain-containing protein n=1 Tax=Heliobacterium chlorum TaxID=2698 RepID=A0ABR7SWW8_HELCL|nr:DUF294 nucleotidyltransferase-like domain-containing protein [Heliobacterium chlorum]MBC9782956.1 CBS domain-containing protein [Heliobacterium chlorum]
MTHLQEMRMIPPFTLLPDEAWQTLSAATQLVQFHRGQVIFHQGQKAFPHLFLALDGLAEIIVQNDAGEESVIGLRRGREIFGETCLVEKTYPATVKVVEDMTCLTIPFDVLHHLWEKHAAFSAYFSRLFAARFRAMINEIVAEQAGEAYGMDSRPFRKRAVDLMNAPVHTISIDAPVTAVARAMAEKRVGSLVVIEKEEPVGIITERDLVYKTLADPENYPTLREAVNRQLVTLPPESYYYQVLLTMIREKERYVGILEEGKLIGIVALTDLIRNRDTGALSIVDGIEHGRSIADLVRSTTVIDKLLTAMVAERAQSTEITEVVSELYDRLTLRIIELSLEQLAKQGMTPPVSYCWLTMGSGGRKEQTLRTDQDHAIVFADVPSDQLEKTRGFFMSLGKLVTQGLEACGFARCPGNVMALNSKWCRSFKEWNHQIGSWIEESVPDHVRQLTIFLDFRCVFGDEGLAGKLREAVFSTYRRLPVGLHHLAKDDLRHHVSLGFFKPFVTEKSGEHKDEIDLKRSLMVHLIDCIRVFALRENIQETNTLARLRRLEERGIFNADDVELIRFSFTTLLDMRIQENLRKVRQQQVPDNYIHPYRLSKRDQSSLKEAIQGVIRIQSLTGSSFRVDGYL